MEKLVTRRTCCRLCATQDLILVLPINPSPIADAFVTGDKKHLPQLLFPLDLYQCQECGHVQNIDIVNPELLFRDYLFQTSSSPGLVEHFRQYAEDIVTKFNIQPHSLIVEIGSNDGTLLSYFKKHGMKVLGIDPALNIAQQANAEGICTLPDFFTSALAKTIQETHGLAKLIVANNVYAHTDDLIDMTLAIESLLDEEGIFVFEVSYLLDIVDKFLFDTVYHEHLSYHSILSLKRFFKSHDLQLFDIERISSKGGSIRCFVQKYSGKRQEQPIVENMIQEEIYRGLYQFDIFKNYEQAILSCKKSIHHFIEQARKKNQRIVGYGASTTVITLMYHFELQDQLEYLVDDNQKKQGLYAPGCHLEVKPSTVLYTDKPDIVIILAWQYAEAIMKKHENFIQNDRYFAIPLPTLKVISNLSQLTV